MIDEQLTAAVLVYVGAPGQLSVPSGPEAVKSVFGDAALDLVSRIDAIVRPLYDADPPIWYGLDSDQTYPSIAERVATNHPELGESAVRAIANQYCFIYK